MNTSAHYSGIEIGPDEKSSGKVGQISRKRQTSKHLLSGCIAIIGLDGAGKTTIAKGLLASSSRPMRYLYMGTAIGSSNYALPTSRLLHSLRDYRHRSEPDSYKRNLRRLERQDNMGRIGAFFRLLHRLSEEWFRQLVSWTLQLRGFIVIYDRHFIFECAPDASSGDKNRRLGDRIHFWMLSHAYPKPQHIFFLDAPPEVLFDRKPEATLEYLAVRRKTYLELGKQMPNFVRIDATRPEDEVLMDIQTHIDHLYE